MFRLVGALLLSLSGALLVGSSVLADSGDQPKAADRGPAPRIEPLPTIIAPPTPPPPPTPEEALADGVLIVVSLPTQMMFVFRDGALWGSSGVSTGKRGHSTPPGVFPILQKRVRHRSNLYGGAPMPYMQRLTWDGVALHAGHLPGRPASHGCIRLPWNFARSLYSITDFTSTIVMVTRERLRSAEATVAHVTGKPAAPGPEPKSPAPQLASASTGSAEQTIQLGASPSGPAAEALWQELSSRQPRLAALDHEVVPAIVASRRYYRLRAAGPSAHSLCASLSRSGIACLQVRD